MITFPVACYVVITASAIIIHIYTKLQISCYEICLIFFFSKNNDRTYFYYIMVDTAGFGGRTVHCPI